MLGCVIAQHYNLRPENNMEKSGPCEKDLGSELGAASLNADTFDLEAQKDYTVNENSYLSLEMYDMPAIAIGQRKIENIV
ncbi:unnamed protein product [Arctia plantaginis]|uniref:Uncharacterized protein n=1 Tax=Arctia plantaginis TaxID=874455 RepID=A0A8S1AJ86_ARCPL|nr:unnamed protein product [Arctia plantaginis]